jgi:hypothetical protein
MACPVTTSELKNGKKNNERFGEDSKEDMYPTRMDHTHLFSNDYDVVKDGGERAVFHKIQLLHIILEENLNTGHVKPIAHQYGEHFDTESVYRNLKQQVLEFTTEQLSHDVLLQYMMAIQHPGKWCGMSFQVVLHWYEQIKAYMWLKLIGLLPTQALCLMQSAVEDVIALEYMLQINDTMNTHHNDSLTYMYSQVARNPTCSTCTKMPP